MVAERQTTAEKRGQRARGLDEWKNVATGTDGADDGMAFVESGSGAV